MSSGPVWCSTIVPTVGRASLARAVESALAQQDGPALEVIVVNDSGQPLGGAAWQSDARVRVLNDGQRERSAARNAGAAVARGAFLHFLDDDDWLLPGALRTLAAAAQGTQAAWVYGAAQLVDGAGHCLYQFDHGLAGNCLVQVMTGEWVPLQASVIRREAFAAVGRFDEDINGYEDKDLLARVCLRYDLTGTAEPVAGILRGVWNSTTDYGQQLGKQAWLSRERLLAMPGAWTRLRASARTGYWRGRLARLYAGSALGNLRRGAWGRGVGRAGRAAAAGASADLAKRTFWQGLTRGHLTRGFVPQT
jgi:glycosyltransferase involved in cell wall biosynthesis